MEKAITRDWLTYTQPVPKQQQPLANSPMPYFTAEHKVIWNAISSAGAALAVPFPDSCPSQTELVRAEQDREKALTLCLHCSTSAKLSLCYQHKSKP